MDRRTCLLAGALGALAAPALARPQPPAPAKAQAQAQDAPAKLPEIRIYIPGGAGGGWDQTGRSLGAAIRAAGLADRVAFENKGGKGGTLGLADFVARFNADPAALMVGGMVMVGAIAVNRPKVTLAQVKPLARLTTDTMLLVAHPQSKFKSLRDLVAAMRANLASVAFVGGSLGGVDHMLAGMMVRQLHLETGAMKYLPTSSGKEALDLLAAGKAQVAISGYSEFKAELARGAVVPLAVSSRRARYGIASLSEQGVPTELANWRGVFGAGGVDAEQSAHLGRIVAAATATPAWRQALADNDWSNAWLDGKGFKDALEIDQAIAEVVAMTLKLGGS